MSNCANEDPITGECVQCQEGYAGFACNLCATDNSCASLKPDLTNPTCDKTLEYSAETLEKVYSCDVSQVTGLKNLFLPEMVFQCNTTPIAVGQANSLSPDGSGPMVDVSSVVADLPGSPEASGGTCRWGSSNHMLLDTVFHLHAVS